jgi:predicted enzyme related to lactoylglutathione lyase
MSKHPVVHFEFFSNEPEADAKFYSELFGWELQHMPEMNSAMFNPGGGPGGGLNQVTEGFPAGTLVIYIGTKDINASLANVKKMGGKTLVPRTEIPRMGYYAVFSDLTGNKVGLFEAPPDQ